MVYGLLRALPGDRAFLPPSLADVPANLTPASGRQDHTTSPSASGAVVHGAIRVHRIPPRVGDVAQRPSEWGGTAGDMKVICGRGQERILKIGNRTEAIEVGWWRQRGNEFVRLGWVDVCTDGRDQIVPRPERFRNALLNGYRGRGYLTRFQS